MVCGIVFPDIIRKQAVELREGMDGFDVKCVQPSFLERTEMPFDFPLACPIPYFCMEEHRPDGAADQGKLLICIAAPIVHI